MERVSVDDCLKTSPETNMNHTLTITQWHTVGITIPNEMMDKTQFLFRLSWSNLPTLT